MSLVWGDCDSTSSSTSSRSPSPLSSFTPARKRVYDEAPSFVTPLPPKSAKIAPQLAVTPAPAALPKPKLDKATPKSKQPTSPSRRSPRFLPGKASRAMEDFPTSDMSPKSDTMMRNAFLVSSFASSTSSTSSVPNLDVSTSSASNLDVSTSSADAEVDVAAPDDCPAVFAKSAAANIAFFSDPANAGGYKPFLNTPHPTVLHIKSAMRAWEKHWGPPRCDDDPAGPFQLDYLLVATGVDASYTLPHVPGVKNYLDELGNFLIIVCSSGDAHGNCVGTLVDNCAIWRNANGIADSDFITLSDVVRNASGHFLAADVTMGPRYPKDAQNKSPPPRLVMEVDLNHRSARALRDIGRVYLNEHVTRSYLMVKVYPRRDDGTFAAIAVLWQKNPGNHHRRFVIARDFGTATVHPSVKAALATVDANSLAAVPVGSYIIPATPDEWLVRIPRGNIVFQAVGKNGIAIPMAAPVGTPHGGDRVIDLFRLREDLDDCLPPL